MARCTAPLPLRWLPFLAALCLLAGPLSGPRPCLAADRNEDMFTILIEPKGEETRKPKPNLAQPPAPRPAAPATRPEQVFRPDSPAAPGIKPAPPVAQDMKPAAPAAAQQGEEKPKPVAKKKAADQPPADATATPGAPASSDEAAAQTARKLVKDTLAFSNPPLDTRPDLVTTSIDYAKTVPGLRRAEMERRQREMAHLLNALKEHFVNVELKSCHLVETKHSYDYTFIRDANLAKLDAYDVTYTRQDGGGFQFTLKTAKGGDAVLYLQQRNKRQISEHVNNHIVYRTSITDGMQAFVLKQRLQELINRCVLGDDYKAGGSLVSADAPMKDAVRVEGPVKVRRNK